MSRERVSFTVSIELDPIPGAMHTKESAKSAIEDIISSRMPSYNPRVYLSAEKALTEIQRIVTRAVARGDNSSYIDDIDEILTDQLLEEMNSHAQG